MVFRGYIKAIFISRHSMLTPVYRNWSGVSQVRGLDPKSVNVTDGVGYQTSMLYMLCFGGGSTPGDLKCVCVWGGGGSGSKLIQSSKLSATDKQTKINNLISRRNRPRSKILVRIQLCL